ncbi:o-succinylbenzoate synthase [Leucobacter rhizosphaerae]|uniref:o-succinylbenzoate synthase n=1 Tax=Leucobacter rhizosphaerae TaxID=2932245 RepID=A0ABY4FUF5_9MICO|nr:o-succinylbenzoate synthase [Leucobacter rhizosphaerae]UOQ59789.1 o-succinylbenzoate synthase [Leucobacter rhizosphaerae]
MSGRPLPPLDTVLDAARVVTIPTRTRFRGVSVREAVLLAGPEGPSEFSPFVEYDDAEAATWLAGALDFGWHPQPAMRRDRIAVNATVPAVDPEAVPGILARFPGCRTAKVKVAERGQDLAADVARVRAVREAMDDEARVRIDANGGWTVEQAVDALRALASFDLDYAEQPCATVAELVAVRDALAGSGTRVRIAADESVRKADDPIAVARSGAADLLILKAQPLGGIPNALGIVAEAGLPVVVSSALDTSVGIAMGLRLAAALPEELLAGACGLGTVALLDGDVTADSLLPVDGAIAVRRPALDAALLERHRATPEREAWWRERIRRCYDVLVQRAAAVG